MRCFNSVSAIEPKFFGMELISQYLKNDEVDVDVDKDVDDDVACNADTLFDLVSFWKLSIFRWTLASSK